MPDATANIAQQDNEHEEVTPRRVLRTRAPAIARPQQQQQEEGDVPQQPRERQSLVLLRNHNAVDRAVHMEAVNRDILEALRQQRLMRAQQQMALMQQRRMHELQRQFHHDALAANGGQANNNNNNMQDDAVEGLNLGLINGDGAAHVIWRERLRQRIRDAWLERRADQPPGADDELPWQRHMRAQIGLLRHRHMIGLQENVEEHAANTVPLYDEIVQRFKLKPIKEEEEDQEESHNTDVEMVCRILS